MTPTMVGLLTALLVLPFTCSLLLAALLLLRRVRTSRKDCRHPIHDAEQHMSNSSSHGRFTIHAASSGRTSRSIHVYEEKQNLIANSSSPPPSPVPEIRVTFPEEIDETGRRQSGRVVVVRLGDTGVGLEPMVETEVPPYQESASDRFHSLDLDRIGGLKEKEYRI